MLLCVARLATVPVTVAVVISKTGMPTLLACGADGHCLSTASQGAIVKFHLVAGFAKQGLRGHAGSELARKDLEILKPRGLLAGSCDLRDRMVVLAAGVSACGGRCGVSVPTEYRQ